MLACPDEGIRPCGDVGANKGAGKPEKSGPCWRVPTKDKGLAGNKAPTKAPEAGRNQAELACPDEGIRPCGEIGANKGAGRLGKIRAVLACPNEGQRPCGEQGANKGAGKPGESRPCWRAPTKE